MLREQRNQEQQARLILQMQRNAMIMIQGQHSLTKERKKEEIK